MNSGTKSRIKMIKRLVFETGLAKGEIAQRLGVPFPTFSGWITGSSTIPDDKLRAFLRICAEEGIYASFDKVRAANGHPQRILEDHSPAALLVKARAEKGLTLEEVGRAVGVTKQSVDEWEEKGPPLSRIPALAQALGVTAEELRAPADSPGPRPVTGRRGCRRGR
jgi:transcriptional regulator with XRE-family HTH domain